MLVFFSYYCIIIDITIGKTNMGLAQIDKFYFFVLFFVVNKLITKMAQKCYLMAKHSDFI